MAEPLTLALGVTAAVGSLYALSRPSVRVKLASALSSSSGAIRGALAGSSVKPSSGSALPSPQPTTPKPSSQNKPRNLVAVAWNKVKLSMDVRTANRDPNTLQPVFKARILPYLEAVNKQFPQYQMRIVEARRSTERQQYLYSTNRKGHWVTNCDGVKVVSFHQSGLACDVLLFEPDGSLAPDKVYLQVYNAVKLETFGLERISLELGHIQIAGATAHTLKDGRLTPAFLSQIGAQAY